MFLKFLRDRCGSVLPTFAIAAVPLIVATGAVVDYTNAYHQRTLVQDAMDAAALAAGKQIGVVSTDLVKLEAQNFFTANITGKYIAEYPTLASTITGATVDLTTTLHVPTYFLGIIGIHQFIFSLAAQVTSGVGTLEIALVLDNSGSMAGTKIATLKTAATDLANTLFGLVGTSTKPDPVKMAVVPFGAGVNVGSAYANAAWMDTGGKGTYTADAMKAYGAAATTNNFDLLKYLKDSSGNAVTWKGCVEERPIPYDAQDDAPSTAANPSTEEKKTLFVPMVAPDEPDNWTCGTGTCNFVGTSNSTRRYNGAPTGSQSYNNYLPDAGDATSCGTAFPTFTVTSASPAVITSNGHGLTAGTEIVLSTTGSLYTGLTAGNSYYVAAAGLTANSFRVSASSTTPTFTVTCANPAVFTSNGHGLSAGNAVAFTTTGSLCTGLTAGTTYYVISSGLSTNSFRVSATSGGSAVAASGSQSGTHKFTSMVGTSGSQSGTHTYVVATRAAQLTCQSGSANCGGTNIGKSEQSGFAGSNISTALLCKYGTGTSNKGTVANITVGGYTGGPNYLCTTPALTPLTATKATVTTAITNLVANGYTNILAGVAWGWRLLSPGEPFTDGRAYSDTDNQKIMVVMTDGENTYNTNSKFLKSFYAARGYIISNRLGIGTSPTSAQLIAAINARTLEACKNAKAAKVKIYTIGFEINSTTVSDPATALQLLKDCATQEDMYYDAQNESQLLAAFTAIGDSISQLRIVR